MRLLIAGCGDLGSRLGVRWLARGGEVLALRRRVDGLPSGFGRIAADLGQPIPAGAIPRGIDAVAYLASADERSPEAYRRAYVDGPRRLLDALGAAPARFVFASSTAVYGEDAGGWVDEESPTRPETFNGELLCEAEACLRRALGEACVLRFSGLYGPGREWMLRRARAGEPGDRRWGNRIHIDDAAAALEHLLALPRLPQLLCVSDDRPALDREVLEHLRRLAGLPAVPEPGEAKSAERGRRVRNGRLRASGAVLRYPDFAAGYAAVLGQPAPARALL